MKWTVHNRIIQVRMSHASKSPIVFSQLLKHCISVSVYNSKSGLLSILNCSHKNEIVVIHSRLKKLMDFGLFFFARTSVLNWFTNTKKKSDKIPSTDFVDQMSLVFTEH